MIKRYCNDMRNTIIFERGVLSEVTCHAVEALKAHDFDYSVGLEHKGKPTNKLRKACIGLMPTNGLN